MCQIRTAIISGGHARSTRLRLSVVFGCFLAISYGLMRSLTHFFIFTRPRRGSRHTMKCVQPSGDTTRDSAHVDSRFPYPLRNQLPHRGGLPFKEVIKMRAVMNCQICGKKNRLNEKNTVLHVFTRQPAFSWCELICDHCETHQEFFFAPDSWEPHLRAVIDSKTGVIEEEWVDDKTYGEYLDTWWQGEERSLTRTRRTSSFSPGSLSTTTLGSSTTLKGGRCD